MDKRPSKSSRKRDAEDRQRLGAALSRLNAGQLAKAPLSNELQKALAEYQRMRSQGARRRQMQYIGRLMRAEDADAITVVLDEFEQRSVHARHSHREAERWRERLLTTDTALTEYVDTFPGTDRVTLRHLIRDARHRPDQSSRTLFRSIRADQERADQERADQESTNLTPADHTFTE